ncbi:hypothetical protein [Natronomonas sp. EA1]|uniref:hypothetical protein n=1 Tax=Natronomonas sp. EA1 TaxID=3421655 RepID=UPI003EBED92B
MSSDLTTAAPTFGSHPSRRSIVVRDPVEDELFLFDTTVPVTPEPCATDAAPFCFPIDSAARVATNELSVPYRVKVVVRTEDTTAVEQISEATARTVSPRGFYTVELSSVPFKILLAADSRLHVDTRDDTTTLRFPDTDELYIGARSSHLRPTRTLTTTRDPTDLMTVISEFGAALKTTSCERSWPTLRGHPPLVELGEALHLPGGRQRPDTGVTIELPPTLERLFPVTPLAFYLGAELVPGETPTLRTDTGVAFDLTARGGFESTVSDVLQHVFTLDCFTRCEGLYAISLISRERAALGLDYEALYDRSLGEQLERYLAVPFEEVEPFRPTWLVTADVPTTPDTVAVLPHLASELALVRGYEPSGSATRDGSRQRETLTRMPPVETAQHLYFGDGFAVGANKGVLAAYERRFQRRPSGGIDIGVTVVCNDESMVEEVRSSPYGDRDQFDFDVTTRADLTVDELRAVFRSNVDLVHYIGHVDADGLACRDGVLDASDIGSVGATAFILNGCRSVWQGRRLTEQGAEGGIITFEDVPDRTAATVGSHVARLLNLGWRLDSAVAVVKEAAIAASSYAAIGYPGTRIVDNEAGVGLLADVVPRDDGRFDLSCETFSAKSFPQAGGVVTLYELPVVEGDELHGATFGPYTVDATGLSRFLGAEPLPVRIRSSDGVRRHSLHWSDELDLHSVQEASRIDGEFMGDAG